MCLYILLSYISFLIKDYSNIDACSRRFLCIEIFANIQEGIVSQSIAQLCPSIVSGCLPMPSPICLSSPMQQTTYTYPTLLIVPMFLTIAIFSSQHFFPFLVFIIMVIGMSVYIGAGRHACKPRLVKIIHIQSNSN